MPIAGAWQDEGHARGLQGAFVTALDDADVHAVLSAALTAGGDFAEIFAETRRGRSLRFDDGKVEKLTSGLDRGAGIRVSRAGRTPTPTPTCSPATHWWTRRRSPPRRSRGSQLRGSGRCLDPPLVRW